MKKGEEVLYIGAESFLMDLNLPLVQHDEEKAHDIGDKCCARLHQLTPNWQNTRLLHHEFIGLLALERDGEL